MRLLLRLARWIFRPPEPPPEAEEDPDGVYQESIDLVYNQVIRTVDAQQAYISTLDNKASFVLTAASIIIGFQGLPGATGSLGVHDPKWLIPAFVVYVALLIAIFQAYRLRGFTSAGLEPAALQLYYEESPEFAKRQFVATMRLAYEENIPQVNRKALWLRVAEWLLLVQVLALVLSTLLSREWGRVEEWIELGYSWVT